MERSRLLLRLGVAVSAALAAVLALVYTVQAIDRLQAKAQENAALNYDDRELGGGNSLGVDKAALYEARALIPRDGSYRLLTGPALDTSNPLTKPHIEEYARYFLMPRRPAGDARWIICYGCDQSKLGRRFQVLWQSGSGIAIGRLRP
jgi:hypothetical protein